MLSAVSSRDVTQRPLEESYHVATLDHDAERIFSESAEFVARVTARRERPRSMPPPLRNLVCVSGTSNDDEAWRAIVDNYGERPAAEDLPAPVAEPEPPPERWWRRTTRPIETPTRSCLPTATRPTPRLPRHLPWLAVFGVPALLLVSLLAGISLPTWLGYLLVCGSWAASSTSCSR